MFSLDFIKKQIDFKLAYGIVDFEITGGEPSEHAQLREVCEYIKSKSPASKIAVITNGGLWRADVWDIIDEVLISYHLSRNASPVPMLPLGCTYAKCAKTVEKAHCNGVLVRTNSVLGVFNNNDYSLVDDLLSFKPSIVNFLPLNLFDDAIGLYDAIDYNTLRSLLDAFMPKLYSSQEKPLVFIRYAPICVLEQYKQHIVGHVQHIYDWFDWNRELDGINLLDIISQGKQMQFLDYLGKYGSRSLEFALNERKSLYDKPLQCMKCKYQVICDGIDKCNGGQLHKYLKPINGQIVKNCLEFVGNVQYSKYMEIYNAKIA